MKPREYAEKLIHLDQISLRPEVSINEAAVLVLRTGYPEPKNGVDLFVSHRGTANNGIDWPLRHLRNGVTQLIENVAEDCISVIEHIADMDSDSRTKAIAAIREHFEIRLN